MPPKRKNNSPDKRVVKRAKKVMSLEDKMKILDSLRRGEKVVFLAQQYQVNESTIRTIRNNEKEIRETAEQVGVHGKTVKYVRSTNMEKMEDMLYIWIKDKTRQRVPLSSAVIREQALYYFDYLNKEISKTNEKITASKGWFEGFKKRYSLHNVKFSGESASADYKAATEFPKVFKELIAEKGYHASQVFNCDETGLFWKKMPNRTFLTKDENKAAGFKISKDRYTLMLCSNASGTYKCKPLLVYKSENPRALKGKRKDHLPVFWQFNKKAWVTGTIMEDWISKSFMPEVQSFLKTENLDFKVLLLMDNAPSHPKNLSDAHPNLEVLFLPPNTTSLLQPMDQTVISTFKAYYLRRVLKNMIADINRIPAGQVDPTGVVRDYWKTFSILQSILIVQSSWEEVSSYTLNASWRKLWPEIVQDKQSELNAQQIAQQVVEVAKGIEADGFKDMEAAEVVNLINENIDLTPSALVEILDPGHVPDDDDDLGSQEEPPHLSYKTVANTMSLTQEAFELLILNDPIMSRSIKFRHDCEEAMRPYTELQSDLLRRAKQSRVTDFFNKKN
ncbi:tigger transposable element-derived protein 1-like [Phymastichus coffea]|uniref:tigger transposable element-derived protein 1-like n=1 Tax=Phymastichus coffea TaxID=108790 RepID=UPI00273C4057|nr:tigger transposable element-derived protein 1-like [Phymastichus coffea]